MRRVRLSALLIGLIAVLAVVAAGCGGSDSESRSGGGDTSGSAPAQGKQGGDLTFLAAADVDYLDPGQSYYTFGYQVLYSVNRPLYMFAPGEPDKPQADLADGDPQISDDKKQITVKIKPGIKYAPPVNRAVTSADVKYAFERAFSANVPSGYATSYFGDIVGAPDRADEGRQAHRGHHDPGRADDRDQAQAAGRRDRGAGAGHADHGPGAEGVREEVRRQVARPSTTSTSPSPARTWSRTTRAPAR